MFPSGGAIFKSTTIMTMSKSELWKSLTVELIVVKCETDRQTDRRTNGQTDRVNCVCCIDFSGMKKLGKKSKTIFCTMTTDCLCYDFLELHNSYILSTNGILSILVSVFRDKDNVRLIRNVHY